MLPVEKSSDPSCSYNLSKLKTDGRPSSKVALDKAADLLNTCADDDNQTQLVHHSTFSLRNYVCRSRQHTNIEKHWPFSQHSLQLCLKHDLKDVLPPLESPQSLKKQWLSGALVCQPDNKDTAEEVGCEEVDNAKVQPNGLEYEAAEEISYRLVESSQQIQPPLKEKEKLRFPVETSLCGSDHSIGSEDQISPTLISHAQPESGSVPGSVIPCPVLELATSNLSGALVEFQNLRPPCPLKKNEATVEASVRKCRLIVKLAPISDPSGEDDITPNTAAVSDPMASKVCPVCKSFSSTSNTTLNAHIDQCLSMESTSKWDMDTNELPSHKVKPKRKRSLVDIYKTAQRCTLEELDRRNGTNWATDSSVPNAESEVCAQGKRQRMSHVDVEDNVGQSEVYFDSNGTKLRILSKFANASVSTAGEDSRPVKKKKKDKRSKVLLSDRKKHFGPKCSKQLEGKFCNMKLVSVDTAEIHGAPQMKHGMDKSCETEESQAHLLKDHDEINHSESGTLRQWVCSKRSRLLKKINGKDVRRVVGYPLTMATTPLNDSNKTTSGDSSFHGGEIQKTSKPSEDVISASKGKHVDSSFSGVQTNDGGTESPEAPESELQLLIRKSTSSPTGACILKLPRSPGTFASCPRSKRIEVHASKMESPDSSPKKKQNPLESYKNVSKKVRKVSTLGNVISARSTSSSFKSKEGEKSLSKKSSCLHRSLADLAAEVGTLPSSVDFQYGWVHDSTENVHRSLKQIRTGNLDRSSDTVLVEREYTTDQVSIARRGVRKPRRKIETCISGKEQAVVSRSTLSGVEGCCLDQAAPSVSHLTVPFTNGADGTETGLEKVPFHEDLITNTISKKDVRGVLVHLSKPLVSEPHKLASSFDSQIDCSQSTEEHEVHAFQTEAMFPLVEQELHDELEMYERNEISNTVSQNTWMGSQLNSKVGKESSSFKGQYAADPAARASSMACLRDMGSDDLQENSSVTSSKILSSQDRRLRVDRDLSVSPVSATSIISNLTMARATSKYKELASYEEPPEVRVKSISGASSRLPFMLKGVERVDSDGEDLRATTPREGFNTRPTSKYSEPLSSEVSPDVRVKFILGAPGKVPFMLKGVERIDSEGGVLRASTTVRDGSKKFTDNQPCCCSRKEGFSLGASLGYQDPQFLEQRTASLEMYAKGKQITYANVGPEISSPSSGSVSRKNDAAFSVFEFPNGPLSRKAPSATAQKLSTRSDFSPARQSSQVHDVKSSSNPVLRLMGKNLMVVNKDDSIPGQLRQQPQVSPSKFPSTAYTDLRFSTDNVSYQDCYSFYHTAPEGSTIFSHDSCHQPQPQYLGVNHSESLDTLCYSRSHQAHPKEMSSNHYTMDVGGLGGSSLPQHGFRARFDLPTKQKVTTGRTGYREREVIIIDDSPEEEAEPSTISRNYATGFKQSQPSPVGVLPPSAACLNLRQINGFSCHTSSNPFAHIEPPGGSKPNYLVSGPLKWGGTTERQGALYDFPKLP